MPARGRSTPAIITGTVSPNTPEDTADRNTAALAAHSRSSTGEQSDVPGQATPLVRDEGTSCHSHTLEPMPVDNHPAFEIVSRIVGLCRPKSVFRSRTGRLILVVEHLSDAERSRIEEAVGEGIEVRHGRPTPRPRA